MTSCFIKMGFTQYVRDTKSFVTDTGIKSKVRVTCSFVRDTYVVGTRQCYKVSYMYILVCRIQDLGFRGRTQYLVLTTKYSIRNTQYFVSRFPFSTDSNLLPFMIKVQSSEDNGDYSNKPMFNCEFICVRSPLKQANYENIFISVFNK